MLLAMSPFALADENTPDTTGQGQPAGQTYAAKIGENKYPTIADAIDAANIYDANSDVTIVMLHDVTENIEINRSLTLDLGGYTLSGDGKKTVVSISGEDKDMDVTVKNGTVTGGHATNGGGFDIKRGNIEIENCIIEKNTATSGRKSEIIRLLVLAAALFIWRRAGHTMDTIIAFVRLLTRNSTETRRLSVVLLV